MSDFQIKKSSTIYDAVIVGSGAGGGMAAYVLAHAGLKVLLVEAGPFFDPAVDSHQLKWPWESIRRGAPTNRPFGDFDGSYGGYRIEGEPYTTKDGTKFGWFRSRMLGGRTNHWGRISLRMGPNDFKSYHLDGISEDWPITYEDIKPFYDKVDRLIGVYGSMEGLENDPDGIFLPPPKLRLNEHLIKQGATKAGVKVIPGRGSVLTQKLPGNDERSACFYCGQCGRSCKIYGDFSSSSCLVIPAMKTGNLKVITNAMVRKVLTGHNGLATGVSYVSKNDMQEHEVKASVVVLGASTCESARILLNSKSPIHSAGLANSSGVVGKYLHDSTATGLSAFLPQLMDRKRYNEDGLGSIHIYSPWWLDNKKLDFPRGYHIEYGGGMDMPTYGFGRDILKMNGQVPGKDGNKKEAGGYGASLKEDYRRFYGTHISMASRGVAIAREDNYCEIDPGVVDKFGIPVLRFNYKWADTEIKQAKHTIETFQAILHETGAILTTEIPGAENNYGLLTPGQTIHEVGTIRMGSDPKTSALNKYCQAHDCENLFVVDASPFVQQSDKNPTWTILALAMRTAEYILAQRKKLNIRS